MRLRQATLTLLLLLAAPRGAEAALTPSEKAVVKTFVEKGDLASVGRVRALVARPDLTADEVVEPLVAGYAAVPFDAALERFTDALLFGPGSDASRNTLSVALVESLLRRASTLMSRVPVAPGARVGREERAAVDEVLAIHRFVARRIANAGTPPPDGFDPSQGIRADARLLAFKKYKEHFTMHERWFSLREAPPPERARYAGQVALTLANLGAGVSSRFEVSQTLGLDRVRRALFERTGVLVLVERPTTEARIAEAVALLESAPGAAEGLGLFLLGKARLTDLSGRGDLERAGVVLTPAPRPLEPEDLWPSDVKPSLPDRALAALALQVASRAVRHALASGGALLSRAREVAGRAERVGPTGYLAADVLPRGLASPRGGAAAPGAQEVLAGAVRLVLLDAGRAFDLALIREGAGKAGPLEQFVLALSILSSGCREVTLRRVEEDGRLAPFPVTEIEQADGIVTAFTLGGRKVTIVPGEAGEIEARVDGKRPVLTHLPSFVVRVEGGALWTHGGAEFGRLSGEPRVASLDDGRLVLEGGTSGYDGIGTGSDGTDQRVSADLQVTAGSAALLVRAARGETSLAGLALVVEARPARARLLMFDGKGKAFELSPWQALPAASPTGHAATLAAQGGTLTARVGEQTLTASLSASAPATGKLGLAALGGGRVEVRSFSSGEPAPAASGRGKKK